MRIILILLIHVLISFLSEIVSLKQQQRRVVYKNSNNRTCTLANVPKTTTLNSFIKYNDWVDSALDANSPSDDSEQQLFIIRHLHDVYPPLASGQDCSRQEQRLLVLVIERSVIGNRVSSIVAALIF